MGGERVALIVAVDNYSHPGLAQLISPGADADALAGVLADPERGNFDVQVLRNEVSSVIAERVEALFMDRRIDDLVLLHFSCHGLKDANGELYLAAANTRPDRLASTAVDAALVNRLMRRSRAKRVVLLMDCCYGGAFERGVVTRAAGTVDVGEQFAQDAPGEGRGRVVITASSAVEYAFEGASLAQGGRPLPSYFTGAVVEGIVTGKADRDKDGRVSVGELYDYVYDRVREQTPHQTPSKWEFGTTGEFFISENPHPEIVPINPDELLDLAEHLLPAARLTAVQELAALAAGPRLGIALGAVQVLHKSQTDDSQRVAASAAEALQAIGPHISDEVIDFGTILVGKPAPPALLTVTGPPLTQSFTISTSPAALSASKDGRTVRLSLNTATPALVDGHVTIVSPTGTVVAKVTARITQPQTAGEPTKRFRRRLRREETSSTILVSTAGVETVHRPGSHQLIDPSDEGPGLRSTPTRPATSVSPHPTSPDPVTEITTITPDPTAAGKPNQPTPTRRGNLDIGSRPGRRWPWLIGLVIVTLLVTVGAIVASATGNVMAWGNGFAYGLLGNGEATDSSVPVRVPGLTNITAIAGGQFTAYALLSDGTVTAWGKGDEGQLGNGGTRDSLMQVRVSGLTGVTAIAGGWTSGYALSADGTVTAWGRGNEGQLGNGGTSDSSVPVRVSGLTGVTAIAGGRFAGYALLAGGTVAAWGRNLGNGGSSDSSVPVQVSGLTGVTAITAGGSNGFALLADGTVMAWGSREDGLMGGGTTDSLVPVPVSGLTGVTAITAGGPTVYALLTDGTVMAWGRGSEGQLGNGEMSDSARPVAVSGLTGVIAVGCGESTGYALVQTRTVMAWGDGTSGQLGNGHNEDAGVPVQVAGLTGVSAIASSASKAGYAIR